MQSRTILGLQAMSLALVLVCSGCRVEKDGHGNNDVKVTTPFGGMQVKTDESIAKEDVGIPIYPGATPVTKEEDGKNHGSADINMSFGSFKMRVKALSYHSNDSSEKIEAFYRNALKTYGDVIECENDRAVGKPTQTSQGLTCDNKKGNHIAVAANDNPAKRELKTGSQQHQHVVALDQDGSGTRIGLIALDLPGHLSIGSDDDSDKQ